MKNESAPLDGKSPQTLQFQESHPPVNEMSGRDQCTENFDQHEKITDAELEVLGVVLHHPKASVKVCQRIIGTLAHEGTEGAMRVLKGYYPNAPADLKQWTEFAMQECGFFLSMSKRS
jgi:hypothetical protein